MKTKNSINIMKLFSKLLDEKITDFTLPPPSFEVEVVDVSRVIYASSRVVNFIL